MKSGSMQPDHNLHLANDQADETQATRRETARGATSLEAAHPQYDGQTVAAPHREAITEAGEAITEAGEAITEAGEGGITMQEAVALAMGSHAPAERVQRVQARVLCSALVEIRWKGPDGCTETAMANMEEIWQSGASLDLEVNVPEGAAIRLRHGADVLDARVLYCQQNLTGYSMGVQFTGSSFWSPERFVPSHAVELRALGKDGAVDETDMSSPTDTPGVASRSLTQSRKSASSALVPRPLTLDGLSPLISRGSLVALRQHFRTEQPV